jgi:septal ring factor EnvC (AmiA/AmiB activator)
MHFDSAVDECDLSVFIRTQTTITRDIKKCRDKMEEHKEAIMNLIKQLATHQSEYDKNKARLDDLLEEQMSRAKAAASAPAASASAASASAAAAAPASPAASAAAASSAAAAAAVELDTDEDYVIDPSKLVTYDNTNNTSDKVKITVKYWNGPFHEETFGSVLTRGSKVIDSRETYCAKALPPINGRPAR